VEGEAFSQNMCPCPLRSSVSRAATAEALGGRSQRRPWPLSRLGTELALGLRRPAADLPAAGAKRRVADHGLARRDIVQQSVGGPPLSGSSQLGTPLDESFPGCSVPLVLEEMHQGVGPLAAFRRVFTEHLAPRAMRVLAQMVEIQPQSVQLRQVQLHLRPDPWRAVHHGHALLGVAERRSAIRSHAVPFRSGTTRGARFISHSLRLTDAQQKLPK